MTARTQTNIALIGLGMVARTHVRAIADLGAQCRLAGVMSRTEDTARAFLLSACPERAQSLTIYRDVAAVADDPTIDMVIVCTPPNARMELVDALSAAGKPILMEKPVERTLAAATELVETCERRGTPLGIVFQHRMRASTKALRTVLDDGALGDIAVVEIAVPWWRVQAYYDEPGRGSYARDGGGVLISQAIHTLDLVLSLVGPAKSVQAMARRSALHTLEAEDFVAAGVDFDSGAVGSIVASTASFPGAAESIALHGTKGSALLRSGVLDLTMRNGEQRRVGEETGTGGGADPMAFTHAWHRDIIEDFVSALCAGRKPTAATGRDALKVHALIEALVKSSSEQRAVAVAQVE